MNIYIIPIEEKFRPKKQRFKYPAHNKDYGVEQDFYKYLLKNKHLIVSDPKNADWHYLPIFWTRWHLNHNYGKEGLNELQEEISKKILDENKTFLICQYDDGPVVNTGKAIQFLASRKSDIGIDIPLLSSKLKKPLFPINKKYLASFIGRIITNKIREEMGEEISKRNDIFMFDGNMGSRFFIKNTMRSYISLAPRGYGGSSFRLFESMQLGVVPLLIGDLDTRPFKKFIDWGKISLYQNNTKNLNSLLDNLRKENLLEMGTESKEIYKNELGYQKWCKYVLKELENLKKYEK